MNAKEIALVGAGVMAIAVIGYLAMKPNKKETNSPPNSAMDAIGGAGLVAGFSVFLMFVLVALVVVGFGYAIYQASQGDVDKNIERAGKIKDVIRR